MSSSATPLKADLPREPRVPRSIYVQLGGAVLIWAANWAMTKSVLHDISTVSFVAYRFLTAAPFMAALTIPMRQSLLPLRGERLPLALIGIVQIAGSQFFSTVGLQYVAAGRTVVLLYTMQLWALPLGWLINRDRISLPALWGGVVGFAGLFLFFNTPPVNWRDPQVVLGNCLCLSAGLFWALGACLYRRRKWQTPFWTQTFWQVLWTAVVVAPLLLGPQRATVWTGPVIGMIAYNGIACTALAWWWWGKALSVMPASRAGQIVTLVPVFAVIIGAVWAGEPMTPGTAVSVVLICLGIVLALRARQSALLPHNQQPR
ncbi:MAG: DMT family transporter [Candidatus Korobacteraceae bacterium]|jgi:drug/metabolite transporter (DMT)-like permease